MHANYYFLDAIDTTVEAQALYDELESDVLEYASRYCDENNWWHIQGAVLADNRTVLFHDNPSLTVIDDAWDKTWLEASQAVAYSMAWWLPCSSGLDQWVGKLNQPDLTAADIKTLIESDMPKMLATEYSALAAGQQMARQPLSSYQRSQTARAFEMFLVSGRDGNAPFSPEYAPPYDYRAFDLTDGENGNAIIVVDIHT